MGPDLDASGSPASRSSSSRSPPPTPPTWCATATPTRPSCGCPIDRDGLHAIPLYVEKTVVVVPEGPRGDRGRGGHLADLADELMLHPLDDVLAWDRPPGRLIDERPARPADAIELVASGAGLLVVPQSLARLHHRKTSPTAR